MNSLKKRILVVDDELAMTAAIRRLLEHTGEFEVREENRGTHALIAARAFLPDLILLDVMMPDIDGGELAAEIRAIPRFREVPIVFLTALATKQEVSQHSLIGGDRFLAKPLDSVDLINCLREELQRYSGPSVEKKAGEDTSPHLAY